VVFPYNRVVIVGKTCAPVKGGFTPIRAGPGGGA